MPLSLIEQMKLARNPMEADVINEFMNSDLLSLANYRNIVGAAFPYNQVDKLPGIGFRGYYEDFEESQGIVNPMAESLKIFGGRLDVDQAIIDLEGSQARAVHATLKEQAARMRIERTFIKGDELANPREFDGLQRRITGSQLITNATNGGPLSLGKLDEMLDQVDAMGGVNGLPSQGKVLFMSKKMRRILTAANRDLSTGGITIQEIEGLGRKQRFYDEVPISILDTDDENNLILDFNEVCGSSNDCSSIYCVSFGDTLTTFIQGTPENGTPGINVRELGRLTKSPQESTELVWYLSLAILNGRSAARLEGIQDAPAVA